MRTTKDKAIGMKHYLVYFRGSINNQEFYGNIQMINAKKFDYNGCINQIRAHVLQEHAGNPNITICNIMRLDK